MKKKLLIFAVAGLALASCSSDETVNSLATSGANEISFRPLMNNVTRATSLELSDLESNGFYVTATLTSGDNVYFGNQQFKKNTTPEPDVWAPWNGSAFFTIYWPSGSDVLDFHAFAPAVSSQLTAVNTNVTSLNGCPEYTVTPASAAADQVDFLYATLTGQDAQNTNMALAFGHKESQVGIKLSNSDAALNFTVSEISICKIASSGIYKNRDVAPSTSTSMEWGDFGVATNYTQTSLGITKNGVQSATDAGTTWILIPHPLAKPAVGQDGKYVSGDPGAVYAGAYIKVKYKCQSTVNSDVYFAGTSSTWAEGIWPISTNASPLTWALGTHYTFTVDLAGGGYHETNQTGTDADLDRVFDLHEITFASVTVSGWADGGNTNISNN